MDAVKFLEERNRMMEDDPKSYNDLKYIPTNSGVVAYVEDWSEKHPRKTRLQDFLEKYQKAKLDSNGFPRETCCSALGYCETCEYPYYKNCRVCWNKPLEE